MAQVKRKIYDERSCSHMGPEERVDHIRKQSAKKWNAPIVHEFEIMVGRFIIDRTQPKIYID